MYKSCLVDEIFIYLKGKNSAYNGITHFSSRPIISIDQFHINDYKMCKQNRNSVHRSSLRINRLY